MEVLPDYAWKTVREFLFGVSFEQLFVVLHERTRRTMHTTITTVDELRHMYGLRDRMYNRFLLVDIPHRVYHSEMSRTRDTVIEIETSIVDRTCRIYQQRANVSTDKNEIKVIVDILSDLMDNVVYTKRHVKRFYSAVLWKLVTFSF